MLAYANPSVTIPFHSYVSIGGVNHGSENAVAVQVVVPTDTAVYGVAADKSKTQTHSIIGAGKSFEKAYVFGTASYAREEHYGKDLTATGGSIGVGYIGKGVALDGSVIVHRAGDAHLDTKVEETTSSATNISGNIKTTTLITTKTTRHRYFDGQVRGFADLGATFDVGQNGEVRVGARSEFGINHDLNGNLGYSHFYNDDRSKLFARIDSDQSAELGFEHAINNTNWSVGAFVFGEKHHGTHDFGGGLHAIYRWGGMGQAPSMRETAKTNVHSVLQNKFRTALHTSSPHAVKNIHHLGNIVTTQTVEESSDQTIEKMDTEPKFTAPTVEVTGNTIHVTDHGISDADGVENVEYILRTVGGTEIKNKTGVFEKLIDGTYTIVTVADVKDGSTGQLVTKENPNRATVEVKNVQTMTQAEFDEIISRLPTDLDDGYVHKDFVFDFNKYLQNDDIEIIDIQLTEIYGHNNLKGKVDLKNNVLRISNEGVFGEKYIVSIMFGSKTNKELRRSHSFETYFLMGK